MHFDHFRFFIEIAQTLCLCSVVIAQDAKKKDEIHRDFANYRFKDFLQKFEPKYVKGLIENQPDRGINSSEKFFDDMFRGMDQTDALLNLKVENIGPPMATMTQVKQSLDQMMRDARRWSPSGSLNPYPNDRFELRPRIYELMKQAIYQARNEMVVMQALREKYRKSKLYKMGFMMSKTDNAIKLFHQFAFRIFRQCGLTRAQVPLRVQLYDNLVTQERLLHLWFNAQLLTDLVEKNDRSLKTTLIKHTDSRLAHWEFED